MFLCICSIFHLLCWKASPVWFWFACLFSICFGWIWFDIGERSNDYLPVHNLVTGFHTLSFCFCWCFVHVYQLGIFSNHTRLCIYCRDRVDDIKWNSGDDRTVKFSTRLFYFINPTNTSLAWQQLTISLLQLNAWIEEYKEGFTQQTTISDCDAVNFSCCNCISFITIMLVDMLELFNNEWHFVNCNGELFQRCCLRQFP